jgi:hypothetical protein
LNPGLDGFEDLIEDVSTSPNPEHRVYSHLDCKRSGVSRWAHV